MDFVYIFILLLPLIVEAASSSDVKVNVYSGPRKCANTGNGKPTKVEPDYTVGLHFTVTIDESSKGSQDNIGKKIESSHDMGFAPSFVGVFLRLSF